MRFGFPIEVAKAWRRKRIVATQFLKVFKSLSSPILLSPIDKPREVEIRLKLGRGGDAG
jgi:hypothetical protein